MFIYVYLGSGFHGQAGKSFSWTSLGYISQYSVMDCVFRLVKITYTFNFLNLVGYLQVKRKRKDPY